MAADLLEDALGQLHGLAQVGLVADHQKLLAAPATHGVHAAQAFLEQLGKLHQHLVAHQMAQLVVDGLEVIDVQQNHRQRPVVALGADDIQGK
ncbi:hypothetical protein D3C86_1728050 [compost metagenome]